MRRSFAQPPRARCALIEAPAAADDPGQGPRNDPGQIRSEYKRRAATGATVAALLQRGRGRSGYRRGDVAVGFCYFLHNAGRQFACNLPTWRAAPDWSDQPPNED